MNGSWSRHFKISIIVGICCILTFIFIKRLYYAGLNMGPPTYRGKALRFLRRNSSGFNEDCLNRLLNLGLLTNDEVLRFMLTENEGIWFLIGENLSVSDDVMIKGYNMLTDEGKNKFRDQWRYWGWTQNRMKLANDVWREQKDKESKSQGKCTLWFPIVNE